MANNWFVDNGLRNSKFLLAIVGVLAAGSAYADHENPPVDLSYSVGWLKSGPAHERMKFTQLRNHMLKIGLENLTAAGLKAAEQDYDTARKICSDDPRLDYGFGLVLWAQGEKNAAISQFEMAARMNGSTPFIPAIEAAAWGSLATGQDERGLTLVTALAAIIAKSNSSSVTASQRRNVALALGNTFGYLEGPGRVDQRIPAVTRAATEVLSVLPGNLQQDFEAGKAAVATRQAELKGLADKTVDQLKADFNSTRIKIQADVIARNTSAQNSTAAISKTRAERRKTQSESAAKLKTVAFQMENVAFRAAIVGQVAANLSVPQPHLEVRDVGPTYSSFAGYNTSSSSDKYSDKYSSGKQPVTVQSHIPMYQGYMRPENSFEQMTRVGMLNQMLGQMQQIETQAATLLTTAQGVQAKRTAAMEQYSQTTQVLQTEMKETLRSKRELTQQLQKLDETQRSLIGLKTNADSLLAYVPWDIERDRVALTKIH